MPRASDQPRAAVSRRRVISGLGAGALASGLVAPAAWAQWRRGEAPLDYAAPEHVADRGLALEPAGACASANARDVQPTPRQTDGPYYSASTPRRSDFSGDGEGLALVVMGRVLDRNCRPVAHAALDFWHADAHGRYDNEGFRFRGHQFTDRSGAFRLSTIRPSGYGAGGGRRPPHIHVKAQGRDTALLTTQLYFPGEANGRDRIFRDGLVMSLSEDGGLLIGRFDFVLARA